MNKQNAKSKEQKIHGVLLEIVEKKKKDLVEQKKNVSLEKLKEHINLDLSLRGVTTTKSKIPEWGQSRVGLFLIGEIKLASPTVSFFESSSQIEQRALVYQAAGIDVLSVITEQHYFNGDPDFIYQLKKKIHIPIMQKDFVIDPYQIYEAKIIGSDALLLIAKLVDQKTLKGFVALTQELGIEPIVEINDEEDLEKAVSTATSFIAVNARNLNTFEVNVDKACTLLESIPQRFIKLGFSGVKSSIEVKKYKEAGAKGILVGTSLMQAKNIYDFINTLRNI